ncbi:OmpA family protein [Fulvivirgaceae bacterium BMA10]|uniref:OmpA family protein n=1 Tax=Splendidivirga corallicola TaxID=3051826 RepID=A0ABT8KMY7_9BACT|nr:OmpA family protein [Fulvivirgaceae bacterium BMA10]
MKAYGKFSLLLITALFFAVESAPAQKIKLGEKLKRKGNQRLNRKIDKTIDKGFDKVEKGVDDSTKSDKKKKDKEPGDNTKSSSKNDGNPVDSTNVENPENNQVLKAWSNYDFVPGNKIIFEDNLLNEQNGEFPSKWDLKRGSVENARFGNENVISFVTRSSTIAPLMKTENYLPEVFTLEFDAYYYLTGNEGYYINFKGGSSIRVNYYNAYMDSFSGNVRSKNRADMKPGWRHIALSFNKRALKVYIDQDRVLNIPNVKNQLVNLSLSALGPAGSSGTSVIKNIRLAAGGVKLYDRFLTDGKIVTHGILFDVNKATIKPESMGVINSIVQIMKDNPDVKFRIEGHTDSDGDDQYNLELSERRAESVKKAFIQEGIAENRMETKGWGESKPMDTNGTSEGKANNRRVEFISIGNEE